MTTQASPDGHQQAAATGSTAATTTTTTTTAAPADSDPVRDWGEVRKVIVSRDEFKAETKELRSLLEGVAQKLEKLGTPATTTAAATEQTTSTTTAEPTGLEAQVKQLAEAMSGIVGEKQNAQKLERRKAITDAIVGQANDASKDLVRGQVALLALDGAIDLHAENTAAEVDKALAALRASSPALFKPPGNAQQAGGGAHDLIPPGVQLHELTPEQLARLPDEDFTKIRRAGRTTRLAY